MVRMVRKIYKGLIIISLLWLLLLLLESFNSECFWGNCKKIGYARNDNENSNRIEEEREIEDKNKKASIYKFKGTVLKRWIPAAVRKTEEQFYKYNLNVLSSDRISLTRPLQDVRLDECQRIKYPEFLPTTSVVIVFHNEAASTLLRTVWSVISSSPRTLLREIILVDDASDSEHLGKQLEEYVVKLHVRVQLLRTAKRYGLVRARLLAVKHVTGLVITFLDSHCECTYGWLVPLLSRIEKDRRIVVSPVIDHISKGTFEYVRSSPNKYRDFDWHLQFKWRDFPQKLFANRTAPIRIPVISEIFSIDKKYFNEIGSYDEEMDLLEMENLEMSFRIWQCGGVLEIVRCSHVGHVSKDQITDDSGVVERNANRVAKVWMDNWSYFYYALNPYARLEPVGDLSHRIDLRKKLKCKSFRWYLENVHPESLMPLNYYYLGEIRHKVTELCLDTMRRKENGNLGMSYCMHLGDSQLFVYTKNYQIMSNGYCLDAFSAVGPILLKTCNTLVATQTWVYNLEKMTIKNLGTGSCLSKLQQASFNSSPIVEKCNDEKNQKWLMIDRFRWQVDQIN